MSSSSLNCKESSPLNFPYIPDDLLLNCLARVSRLYYPTLSLVSKRFLSLLTSLELYETRRLLGCPESCLYACLPFPPDSNSVRWFTLCRQPIQINAHNPRWFTPCLPPGPPCNSGCGNFIAVGYMIYMIGGCINGAASWHKAPSMHMPRKFPLMSVFDGKIYVVEGDKELDTSNLIEVFDLKTQKWEDVPPSHECYSMKGRHIYGNESVGWDMFLVYYLDSCCVIVIDNVLYRGSENKIEWSDLEGVTWRVLKGVENMKVPFIKLVNNGGKITGFWEEKLSCDKKMIWCAEISLERRNKKEIQGKLEWRNIVFSIPKSCDVKFIAATV